MVIGLCQTYYGGRESPLDDIFNPLLYVPSHPARELDKDLETAGIPKHTPEGKVDFHACRVAYISLLFEAGGIHQGSPDPGPTQHTGFDPEYLR